MTRLFCSMLALCSIVVGCADQPPVTVDGGTADACCCASISEGDIITEAPADSADACAAREQGSCVDQATIDARFTPHACCPDATGERCGD